MLQPLEGAILDGRYHLTHKLGHGAFGVVYAAEQVFLDEVVGHVAIKFLSPPTNEARARVLEEVRAMARLSHPNLVSFRSAGVVDLPGYNDDLFLVCELAEGSLSDVIRKGLLEVEETLVLAKELAMGLQYLEKSHCVHRDVKPANVLRVAGVWKIADFGLARTLENSLTAVSSAFGTPLYMSPEAVRGHISPAVDIWALGAIVQLALTGRMPYEGAKSQEDLYLKMRKNPPFIAPDLPSPLHEIVKGCLSKDTTRRWKAGQVLQALESRDAVSVPQVNGSSSLPRGDEIRVATDGSGDCVSISEAIRHAVDGETIVVAPGYYEESLRIDKEIHLRGEIDGNGLRPVIESDFGNVCRLEGGQGSIADLDFRGFAESAGKRFFAFNALGGEWKLRNCSFASDTLAALHVGGEVRLTLEGCQFQSQASGGLLIEGGQSVSLKDCAVQQNARYGLQIKTPPQERVKLCGCIFEENGADGVVVEGGQIEIEKCSLSLNKRAGIDLKTQAHAEISQCRISGNAAQGLIATRNTTGEVTLCDVSGNRFGAFDIPHTSLFARSRNKE